MKKISVVLCSVLFAASFAAGCKKDKKDGEGAAAKNTCEGVGALIAEHMSHEDGMDQAPPEMKKKMEEGMKKVPAAITAACKADKWSQEALDCAATAKDPKEECEGKLTPEQEKNMVTAAMTAMGMGDLAAKMQDKDEVVADPGAGSGSASGTATGSAEAAPVAPVAAGTYPATCEGVAARAMAEMADDLPPGAPADLGAQFGAMLVKTCTDDKWGADVLECGVTAPKPKDDCRPKLSADQAAHLDAAQEALAKEVMEKMAASGGNDGTGAPPAAGGSTGIKECDEFRDALVKLSQCSKLDAATAKQFGDMAAAFENLNMLPEEQKTQMADSCKQGITGIQQTAGASGC